MPFSRCPGNNHDGKDCQFTNTPIPFYAFSGPALSTVPNLRQEWPNGRMESAPLNILYPPDAPYITLEENQWFYTGTILALGCSVSDRGKVDDDDLQIS